MKFKIQLITQREADEEIQELACLDGKPKGSKRSVSPWLKRRHY